MGNLWGRGNQKIGPGIDQLDAFSSFFASQNEIMLMCTE